MKLVNGFEEGLIGAIPANHRLNTDKDRLYEGEFDGLDLPDDASFYSVDLKDTDGDSADVDEDTDEDAEAEKRITSDDGKISFVTHGEEKYIRMNFEDGKKTASVKISLENMECVTATDCFGFVFHLNGGGITGAVSPYVNVSLQEMRMVNLLQRSFFLA